MPSFYQISEGEWIAYTVEEELDKLERLASSRWRFSNGELESLHKSLMRLNNIMSGLAQASDEVPLPDWLQRQDERVPEGSSQVGKSKLSN